MSTRFIGTGNLGSDPELKSPVPINRVDIVVVPPVLLKH